jgi:hypothetical protein
VLVVGAAEPTAHEADVFADPAVAQVEGLTEFGDGESARVQAQQGEDLGAERDAVGPFPEYAGGTGADGAEEAQFRSVDVSGAPLREVVVEGRITVRGRRRPGLRKGGSLKRYVGRQIFRTLAAAHPTHEVLASAA